MLDTVVFDSGTPGPHLLITGAIHGDEVCGTIAIGRTIMELRTGIFKLDKGKVTFAPICNPKAYAANARYSDVNLNRVVQKHKAPSLYEHGLANDVTALIDTADVYLDLHSYSSGTLPFLFLDYDTPAHRAYATALNIPHWVTGWNALYEDAKDLSTGDTMTYANGAGKLGILVECGLHSDPVAALHGYKAIRAALAHFGIAEAFDKTPPAKPDIKRMVSLEVKKKEGRMMQDWQHLDSITKGMPIAQYDDGETLTAPVDGVIILPGKKTALGEEWVYYGVSAE
ncbi:MAG: succinylglutamate desuccinylase/aspartoacylase family protein [Micavibrio sp.]|nr:succinylglutamate desuccinylase/aspartoacylase family protein [Micavibrio sp.]